jgi:branched-chain amino acid transport system ATP-binding protein
MRHETEPRAPDGAGDTRGAEPALDVVQLRVSYHGVRALDGVSLRVRRGQIVALIGGNGNGKSTTLRAIAGLNPLDAGSIRYEGRELGAMPAYQRVALGVSLVPEGRRLFTRLSVRRNLELGAYSRRSAAEVADSVAQMFDLFPVLKERAEQLAGLMSGGEQQMLAIARGLMARPRLLMLDEPSWGIAPKFVTKVLEVIQRVNAGGVSVLLVEQNLHKALSIAHHAYVIQTGRIVLEGDAAALANNDEVRKAYLGG